MTRTSGNPSKTPTCRSFQTQVLRATHSLLGAHAHPDDPSVAIAARWQAVRQPSSELTSGKQTSSHYPRSTGVSPAPGEHGTEWGTVIHALLEALAVNPSADISALAHGVLAEHEMPPDLLPVAVETAQAVTRSDLWARAMAAAQRLVEVPFFLHDGADESHALPRVVRGVIDLAFQEADGWVIADYKTDAVAARDVPALVDYYRPQLAAYAQAWQRITGQAPKETGLYLTRLNRYANT